MGFVYYVLESVLIPPPGFMVLTLLGLALYSLSDRRSLGRRLGAAFIGVGIAALFITSLPITATLLKRGLEAGLSAGNVVAEAAAAGNAPEVIVVLAGDTVSNRTEGGLLAGPQPGALSMGRLRAAVALERITQLPILITGKNAVQGSNISDMMRRVMITEYAVPEAKLPPNLIDRSAQDTWDNAEYAARILRHEGIISAYVVTDGWHMRRALMAFRHTGLHVVPAPVALTRAARPEFGDFIPRTSAWLESYYALHEWLGCAYYTLWS